MVDDSNSKMREEIRRKILNRREAIEPDDDILKVDSELKDVIKDEKVVTLSQKSNLNTEKNSANIPIPPPMSNEYLNYKDTKASKVIDSDLAQGIKTMTVKLKTTNPTVFEGKDKNGFLNRFMNGIPHLKQDNVSNSIIYPKPVSSEKSKPIFSPKPVSSEKSKPIVHPKPVFSEKSKPIIPPKPVFSEKSKPIIPSKKVLPTDDKFKKNDERLSEILKKDVSSKMTGYNNSKQLFKEDRKFKISNRIRKIASNFGDVIGSKEECKNEKKSWLDNKKNANPILKKENNSRSL